MAGVKIVIRERHGQVHLELVHPGDLTSFSVATALEPAAAGTALATIRAGGSRAPEGHVAVAVDAVQACAEGHVGADWQSRFQAMLEHASGRGWITDDRRAIIAHVVDDPASQAPDILLNSGRSIPQLGYGVFRVPPDETERRVSEALEIGYRHIDTAAIYRNEVGVGRAIRSSGLPREELFVTTKLFNDAQGTQRAPGAFARSLEALELDYVDLYLIHWPAPRFDRYVETWGAFERFYSEGTARSIGVSNFLPHHLERLLARAEVVPAVNQIEMHPILQQHGVAEFCRNRGIAVEAWSPLGAGQLPLFDSPVIAEAATSLDRTPAQVILRWHVQRGVVVIPKSSTPARMLENARIFDFSLTEQQMADITALERGGRTGFHPDEWH